MATLPNTHYTLDEYLEFERKSEYKSEYYNGEIFAMAGASRNHNEIGNQLTVLVGQHLRGAKCRGYGPDLRLATPGGLYTYPDLSVVCGQPQFSPRDRDTLINPTLLVEILSPSTEAHDRGFRAKLYFKIESLQQLLLIAQDRYEVELYTRQPGDSWLIQIFEGAEAVVNLSSIGYTLRLSELYERAVFEEQAHGA